MIYTLAAGILLGIALTLGTIALANRPEQKTRKHVLGELKKPLKYAGKVKTWKVEKGGTTK